MQTNLINFNMICFIDKAIMFEKTQMLFSKTVKNPNYNIGLYE